MEKICFKDKFDVVVPLSGNHIEQFKVNLPMIKKYLPYKTIYVIGKMDLSSVFVAEDVFFIDEDNLAEGLTYENIASFLIELCGDDRRAGWYLQQCIKMQYAQVCKDDYYIVWDADTIPLSPISFLDENGCMLFNMKSEHHMPYFVTMERLFKRILNRPDGSFISEGMIINRYIMCHMIDEILAIYSASGKNNKSYLFEALLSAVDKDDLCLSGFSEYETYGNYLYTYYPYLYKKRRLRTCRKGYKFYDHILKEEELITLPYDTITFENYHRKKNMD